MNVSIFVWRTYIWKLRTELPHFLEYELNSPRAYNVLTRNHSEAIQPKQEILSVSKDSKCLQLYLLYISKGENLQLNYTHRLSPAKGHNSLRNTTQGLHFFFFFKENASFWTGVGESGELKPALKDLLLTVKRWSTPCPLLACTRAFVALKEVYSTASHHIHPHRLTHKGLRMSKNAEVGNRKEERRGRGWGKEVFLKCVPFNPFVITARFYPGHFSKILAVSHSVLIAAVC